MGTGAPQVKWNGVTYRKAPEADRPMRVGEAVPDVVRPACGDPADASDQERDLADAAATMEQVTEFAALLVLAGTGAGRWAGLDYFTYALFNRNRNKAVSH